MVFWSSLKERHKLKSIFCQIGLVVMLCAMNYFTMAQQTPTASQKKQISLLYQRLQREVLAQPIAQANCSIDAFLRAKKNSDVDVSYWLKEVKWLYRNGQTNCAARLLQMLRPTAQQTPNNYHQWLLRLSQLLRATEQKDSASVIIRELETLVEPHSPMNGWVKFEQATLFRHNIQFENALQVGNEALKIARSTNDHPLEIAVLNEMGNTSRDIYRQEPTKYLSFFEDALKVATALKDSSEVTYILQGLAYVYFFDNSVDLDKALPYFERALSYFPKQGSLSDRYDLINTFTSLLGYLPTESVKEITLYNQLLPIAQKLNSPSDIRNIHVYLASTYSNNKNFLTAAAHLDSAMRYDAPDWEKDNFYAQRAEVAQALGNVALANEYFQKALSEKERVYLRRNNQSMTQWETQFRTREKDLQLEQQQRQQWLLLGIVVLVSLLLVLAIYSFWRNRIQLRKLAQQNAIIAQQSDELRSLDKAKTRFFSNITHEFRTPLTLILSPLGSLIKEFPHHSSLPLVYANANRLLSLINQLLDLSKIDAGALKPDIQLGNLSVFLQLQVESFQPLAQSRGVDLQFRNQLSSQTEAYYDADKLSKITTNLLSNALKFTPKGGKVVVECQLGEAISETPKQEQSRPQLLMQITDTGVGIPAHELTTIFDRFYQVDNSVQRSFEGSGIGLSLVKELVEVLKGEILVESEIGVGTIFRLCLPVDAHTWDGEFATTQSTISTAFDETKPVEQTSTLIPQPLIKPDNAPVLLIVEDNPDLGLYIGSLFGDSYQVIRATDGKEGLKQAYEAIPDVVITDWMMPNMDGLTMCHHLKNDRRTSHVPVLMLTAKSAIESRLEGFEGGADDYIVKPFHATELQLKVRNWIQRQERLRLRYQQQLAVPQETTPLPETESEFMEQVFAVIDTHLADVSFKVDTLADSLKLNNRTLRRKINSLTNLSPNEIIRNHRLRRAIPLLKKGENIAEVAFKVGFETPSYFSKCFKEGFGYLPSEVSVLPD